MSLIAAWVGVDCKKEKDKISSIYFAADSRISWDKVNYDGGIKVFAAHNYPYIFAYCGDVLFPIMSIEQLIYKIDLGILFDEENDSFETKMEKFATEIKTTIKIYPKLLLPDFQIIMACRHEVYGFHACVLKYSNKKLYSEIIDLPGKSGICYIAGSGNNDLINVLSSTKEDPNEGTSRYCYHCIAKAIEQTKVPTVGGSPQLVGLFRKWNGFVFGIIKDGKRYILGKEINYSPKCDNILWRNDNFEIVDPKTKERKEGATPQPF